MFQLGVGPMLRAFLDAPYTPGLNCRVVLQHGYPRRCVVWVPESAARTMREGGEVPLVVVLHGSSGSGEQFLRISGWREKAEAEGFVAAFPTGLVYRVVDRQRPRHATRWSSFNLPAQIDLDDRPRGYPPAPAPFPADDTGFLRALVADVQAGLAVDRRRIYAAGFSNGGEMCARLAVEASDVFAAVACHGGALDSAHPTVPGHPNVPLLLGLGTLDDRVVAQMQAADPTLLEVPLEPTALLANPVTAAYVRDALVSISLEEKPIARVCRSLSFTELVWHAPVPGNRDGNELVLDVLAGVTHQYPNGRNNPAGFVMADRAWDFFRRHALVPAGAGTAACADARRTSAAA